MWSFACILALSHVLFWKIIWNMTFGKIVRIVGAAFVERLLHAAHHLRSLILIRMLHPTKITNKVIQQPPLRQFLWNDIEKRLQSLAPPTFSVSRADR